MNHDFDAKIPREGTFCEKYDHRTELFGRADVIPMWVADMDFAAPPAVLKALGDRLKHPILGYSFRGEPFWSAAIGWMRRRNGWRLKREWMDFVPGVVPGIVLAIRALTEPGDGIVIQPPVYHPFGILTRLNDRKVVENQLTCMDGRYEIDFHDLDRKLSGAKVFILCNPHNPTGRVFTAGELIRIGELCCKHDVLIVSDEIHSDLIHAPHRHIHLAALDERFATRTATFLAPSKTFGLAGLSTALVVASEKWLRRRLQAEFNKLHADQGNIFGTVALEAAYAHGDEWLDQLLAYLGRNIDYVLRFFAEKMPSVKVVQPEATYLMWFDFSAWGLSSEELLRFMVDKAGIGPNNGAIFGPGGERHIRLNVATQYGIVVQAMDRLYEAYKEHIEISRGPTRTADYTR